MLKKFLLLLCLCLIPIGFAPAEAYRPREETLEIIKNDELKPGEEIIGHVFYIKDRNIDDFAIYEKGESAEVKDDKYDKRMKFFETDNIDLYPFDADSTCDCSGCNLARNTVGRIGTGWSPNRDIILYKLIEELNVKYAGKYDDIREIGGFEEYSAAESKIMCWRVIGYREPRYSIIVNIVGDGKVKVNHEYVNSDQEYYLKSGSDIVIECEPGQEYELKNIRHNGKDGAHDVSTGNTYYPGKIFRNQSFVVTFEPIQPTTYTITLNYHNASQGKAYISEDYSSITDENKTEMEDYIKEGEWRYVHFSPNSGYRVKSVKEDGVDVHYNFNEPYGIQVNGNRVIDIYFESNDGESTTGVIGGTGGSITTGTDHNIEIWYAQGLEAGTACISTSPTECMSPEVTNENVSSGVVRYIHFHPASGYKLVKIEDKGDDGTYNCVTPTSVYCTEAINENRDIVVYYEKEIIPPTIITIDGNPFEHRLTALNVINPSSVSNPNIYEPGDDLGLKTSLAYTKALQLKTNQNILNNASEKWFDDIYTTYGYITDYSPLLNLSTTGDYDGHNGKVGYNKIDITALYPSSIHRALQSIYISPNWYMGTTGEGSDPDPKPDDSKPSTPGNDDKSALKIVSTRDLRWQNIINTYSPKWGLSTTNKNKPLLSKNEVTLAGQTVDISKIKTGYAVEFTFDITKVFAEHTDHNIQINVDFYYKGKKVNDKLYYRNTYGGKPIKLNDSGNDYTKFNLNNSTDKTRFNIRETDRGEKGSRYQFIYYVPGSLYIDGHTLKAGDELDIYFNITARRGSTEYYSYNKLANKLYGWNGWVYSYDLTKNNLQDLGYNAN